MPHQCQIASSLPLLHHRSTSCDPSSQSHDAASSAHATTAVMAPLRVTALVTLCVVGPYTLSKMAIAGYTAYQQILFGSTIGGDALRGEADAFHLLFLFMGTAMGGLRATSILTAQSYRCVPRRLESIITSRSADGTGVVRCASASRGLMVCLALIRGSTAPFAVQNDIGVAATNGEAGRAAGDCICCDSCQHPIESSTRDGAAATSKQTEAVIVSASLVVVLYSTIAALLMKFASRDLIRLIATDTDGGILDVVDAFGQGFWWGALPTLLLYNKEQLLLASGRSLLTFVYGGVVYCSVGIGLAWLWVGKGEGEMMRCSTTVECVKSVAESLSVSAWVAYAALKLHLWADPLCRRAVPSLNTEQIIWRWCLMVKMGGLAPCGDDIEGHPVDGALPAFHRERCPSQLRSFLWTAAPLALSNSLGLARQLVITASTAECSSSTAQAYSISQAYYATAEMVLLAFSSTISAVVAVDARYGPAAIRVVVAWAGLLGVLPLVIPTEIAHFFGGSVFSYGANVVDTVLEDVRLFNILTCVTFLFSAAAMSIAATLHGQRYVWVPLFIQLLSNAVGVCWAVVVNHYQETLGIDCVWQSGGSLLTVVLSTVGLLVLARSILCKGSSSSYAE